VAQGNRDGEEFILCESDVLVFEFDCKATSGCGVHYWFVKQEARTCCPRSVLYCTTCTGGSNSAKRNTWRHAHVHERIKLHILRDLIQFYLGWPADARRSAVGTARLPEWHCDILAIQKCDISVTEMLDCTNSCRGFHVDLLNCLFAFGIGFRLSYLKDPWTLILSRNYRLHCTI